MSPGSPSRPPRPAAQALADRVAGELSAAFRAERRRRGWSATELASRARVSVATVSQIEAGHRASLDVSARLAVALGLSLRSPFGEPGMPSADGRSSMARARGDLVHSAMGELEVRLLRPHGYDVAIDHPYQHFQFAGRADVLAWRREPAALLHIENRTRLPDLGETAGSFNAKCRYLAPRLAEELGLRRFDSQTHVIAALWSAEVLHAVRLRPASIGALAPDSEERLAAWLRGEAPTTGVSRSFVLLDPFATVRQRAFVGLASILGTVRPRVRGYREAAEAGRTLGLRSADRFRTPPRSPRLPADRPPTGSHDG